LDVGKIGAVAILTFAQPALAGPPYVRFSKVH
jgi:hypothetical protein